MDNSNLEPKSSTPSILSFIIIVLSYAILFTLLFHPVPEQNKDLVNILSSSIISLCIGGIIGYWFSSSHIKKQNEKEQKLLEANTSSLTEQTTP